MFPLYTVAIVRIYTKNTILMYRIPAIESVNNIKRKCDTVPTNSNDTMQINTLTSWQVVSGSNSLNGISSNPFLPNSVTIKRISSRLISFAKMMNMQRANPCSRIIVRGIPER